MHSTVAFLPTFFAKSDFQWQLVALFWFVHLSDLLFFILSILEETVCLSVCLSVLSYICLWLSIWSPGNGLSYG